VVVQGGLPQFRALVVLFLLLGTHGHVSCRVHFLHRES
jgi:hypothetical protein